MHVDDAGMLPCALNSTALLVPLITCCCAECMTVSHTQLLKHQTLFISADAHSVPNNRRYRALVGRLGFALRSLCHPLGGLLFLSKIQRN
jgi:hypothetical protein